MLRVTIGKIRDQLLTHPIESFCDAFFVLYASWTLTWVACYFANLSLSAISPIFLLLLPLSVVVLAFKHPTPTSNIPTTGKHARFESLCVLVFVTFGILLTLFLHRPDADDELYLGMALSLLAYADQPIQDLPGYVTQANLHAFQFLGISAYGPLKAMVSYLTGMPLLYSYYLVVPSLMSALTVIVTYRLLRELIPEGWVFGMIFFFIVMLAWGDVHRTLANFGFVRMFQGKSVFVSVVVPALFLYFFLVRDKAQAGYHRFLLAAALVSGVGFSRAGLIIGPLILGLLGLASIDFRTLGKVPRRILVMSGLSVAALLVFAYSSGWSLMNPSQLVYTGKPGGSTSTTTLEMIEYTMGNGFRGMFLLLCVGAGFLFVKDEKRASVYRNYMIIFFVLMLIPWSSDLFAKLIQDTLSWRWMWVVPVPAFASVAMGGAFAGIRQVSNLGSALGAFLVVAMIFSVASPRLVFSDKNKASIRWPDAKLDGNTIYLRWYDEIATVENGKLNLERFEKEF